MSVKKANIKDTTVYLNRQIRRGNEERIEQISDKCLLCGKCSAVCQIGLDGPAIRIAQRSMRRYGINQDYSDIDLGPLKEQLWAQDTAPVPEVKRVIDEKDSLTDFGDQKGFRVLYFSGCMTSLTPAIIKSVYSLLDKAGVNWLHLDKDGGLCCGRPMLVAGRFAPAKQLIRKNTELIRASGCDTLLLSCPICYKIFRDQYKLEGIRVVHHSEYLYDLVRQGILKVEKGDVRYVFHDPCELGRGSGIYEQPRKLLGRAGYIVEADKHHGESICCGGSLGSLTLGYAQREDITRNSLKNLTTGSPDAIATACPLCLNTFSHYSDRPVQDIAEILDKVTSK